MGRNRILWGKKPEVQSYIAEVVGQILSEGMLIQMREANGHWPRNVRSGEVVLYLNKKKRPCQKGKAVCELKIAAELIYL